MEGYPLGPTDLGPFMALTVFVHGLSYLKARLVVNESDQEPALQESPGELRHGWVDRSPPRVLCLEHGSRFSEYSPE